MRMPDLDDLLMDLQLAKQIAIDDRNPNAIVIATMAQAKMLNLDRPQMIDVNSDVQTLSELMDELADDKPKPVVFNITGVEPDRVTYE